MKSIELRAASLLAFCVAVSLLGCGGDEGDQSLDTSLSGGPGLNYQSGTPTEVEESANGERRAVASDVFSPDEESVGNIADGTDSSSEGEDSGSEGVEEPGSDVVGTGDNTWEGMEGIEGVILISDVDSPFDEANVASVGAFFGEIPDSGAPIATYGDCEVIPAANDESTPTTPSLDAGNIQLKGLTQDTLLIWGAQRGASVYSSNLPPTLPDILPSSGTIQVTGTGGDEFPAFDLELNSPEPIIIEAPALGAEEKVDLSGPLTVTWTTSADADFMNIYIAGIDLLSGELAEGPQVSCTVDGDPGTITIPTEALSMIPIESGFLGLGGSYLLIGVSRGTVGTSESPGVVNATALRSTGNIVGVD